LICSTATQYTEKGDITTILYSGPISEAKIVLPVGEFRLFVEITEEFDAYTIYEINPKFDSQVLLYV
jgi:hypothetical protein